MGRTITQKRGLANYGVGEIVDMTGTPTFMMLEHLIEANTKGSLNQ